MPKITYIPKKFSRDSLNMIAVAENIIDTYRAQGFDLTLRQLYYQFVARGYIANTQNEYKRLGSVINDARLAGMIDWNSLVDRTRNVRANSHWDSPESIVLAAASSYYVDRWEGQDNHVEVWIEKDALVGVIDGVCRKWDVPFFSCRGYTSQSEMWVAAQRLLTKVNNEAKNLVIIHLGDHDPSGIDMTRDISDRLNLFCGYDGASVRVVRIALTQAQIAQYNPPPNPAKITDSRANSYINKYGNESWELDALEPSVMVDLVENEIQKYVDGELMFQRTKAEKEDKRRIAKLIECL